MKVGDLVKKTNRWYEEWEEECERRGIVVKKCPSPSECVWVRFYHNGTLEVHNGDFVEVISESR